MKRKLLPALLFLLFVFAAQAQNFQPFRKGPTYHYIAQDSIYSLRIDSVKVVGGDSVFVFNPIARKGGPAAGPTCSGSSLAPVMYAIHANNQFGSQVRKTASRDYIFKTVQGQEFLLKTKATVGQSWTFNATANLTATLTAKGIEPVATISDSVFTYSLSNGKTLKLSKNYGIVSTPNFITYTDTYFKPKDLAFYALPEKGIGQTISSPFAIYNFQPGDKFAYYQKHETGFVSPSVCSEEWIRREVLTRRNSVNGDSIYYTIQEQKLKKGYGMAGNPFGCITPTATTLHPVTITTLVITRNYDPITNSLSNGYNGSTHSGYGNGRVLTGIFNNSTFNQREQVSSIRLNYDNCAKIFQPTIDMSETIVVARGIGLVSQVNFSSLGTTTVTLQAYIKSTETYGTWVSLGQLMATQEDLNKKPLVKAFPNPFTSELTLTFGETSGETQLTLRNTLGQIVWEQETVTAPNSEVKVKLPELSKGLYILQASQNGKVFTYRLVKE